MSSTNWIGRVKKKKRGRHKVEWAGFLNRSSPRVSNKLNYKT